MNSKSILFLFLLFSISHLQAADLLVQEFGPAGTYGSINAAIAAASDGDRIIISDRPGNPPWIEDLNITKSLTLLPAVSGTRFSVLGNHTISPSLSGKQIRIVGMDNDQGNISSTADAPLGARTKVEIVGCKIDGSISFDHSYFDVTVASNEIIGNVTIRFGNVYGNDMLSYLLIVNNDALPGNETIRIMGNRLRGITWNSSSHFMFISNNFIRRTFSANNALAVTNLKDSALEIQQIVNNSIASTGSGTGIGFASINVNNAQFQIYNNVFDRQTSSTFDPLFFPTSVTLSVDVSYNFSDVGDTYLNGSQNNGTNSVSTSFFLSSSLGSTSNNLFDMGNPSIVYYDHDLTRNDPGCYGGSYSMTNYYPQTSNPRVYNVLAPNVILQGNTFDVSAEGFDR